MITTYGGSIVAAVRVPSGVTISATTNGGTSVVTITPGLYVSVVALLTQIRTNLNAQRPVTAGTWNVGNASGGAFADAGASDAITIGVSVGVCSITWTSTDLRDLLGFGSDIAGVASSTGALPARGILQLDCPIFMALRYRAAPRETDARQTKSPTGYVITHVGNSRYCHRNVQWLDVPMDRIWKNEDNSNQSLEQFIDDTQWGLGHSWFDVGSRISITAHDGNVIGYEGGSITNWWLCGFKKLDELVQRSDNGRGWDGLWSVTFPELVTDGS